MYEYKKEKEFLKIHSIIIIFDKSRKLFLSIFYNTKHYTFLK